MFSLISSGIGFVVWAVLMISIYYSNFYSRIDHIEKAVGYTPYLLLIAFIYIVYKVITVFVFPMKKLKFGFFSLFGITLLHVFILSVLYSHFPEVKNSLAGFTKIPPSGIILFWHICELLLYPIFLTFLTRSIGFSIGFFLVPKWRDLDMRIRVPVEISLGFILFTFALLFIGEIGQYNFYGLLTVLILFLVGGFFGHKETYRDIRGRQIVLDNHLPEGTFLEKLNLNLLSIEFGYFFLTFILGVGLINIIRPMPIGWDDLGVYMNFPKIMATSGELLKGAGMYSWQLITGTGFLFNFNASQAFYINQLGGILSVIAIISTLSYFFSETSKKYFLSLPILFAALYYAMPMTVFQQAKDMKLDPAYLFFAVSGLMLFLASWDSKKMDRRNISILALVGLIVGFTFTVKFTSVMLILGIFGLISYRKLSLAGYFGFFFAFLAIFTKLDFWQKMFIWMPRDNHALMLQIIIGLSLLSFISFGFAWFQKKNPSPFVTCIYAYCIFGFALLISMTPWLLKNISESPQKITIDTLLSGTQGTSTFDFKKLYPQSEYDARTKAASDSSITSDGQSQNEDFSRYFGQEKGINNYLKLPVNLSFQKNQSGEFTDITYIFLAFLPGVFLFVRSRFGIYRIMTLLGMIFVVIYCFFPYLSNTHLVDLGIFWTHFFENINLPFGYLVLLALNFGIVILTHFSYIDKKNEEGNDKFKEVMLFMGIYGFLFWLSAFGIVWYGIIVYFGFFLLIGLVASRFLSYDENDIKNEDRMSICFTLSIAFFILFTTYFIESAFPHTWNNLRGTFSDTYLGVVGQYTPKSGMSDVFEDRKDMSIGGSTQKMTVYMQRNYASAGFNEYKYFIMPQDESIFANRSDYLLPIATMNLKDTSNIFANFHEKLLSPDIQNLFSSGKLQNVPLDQLHAFIMQNQNSSNLALDSDLQSLGKYMYSQILYPSKATENLGGIYRIGTFMTYLINKNSTRYYDDSLIFSFETYFYDPSPEVTVDRMQKLGLKFLLVDLNAATIDQDPRHALIGRFEKLLTTMSAKNLKLVTTDNFCLQFALEERSIGKLQTNDEFINIAGTNYESYRNGVRIDRNQKNIQCQNYILKRIQEGADTQYAPLASIKKEMINEGMYGDLTKEKTLLAQYLNQSWFALFEITDLPKDFVLPKPVPFGTGGTH